MKIHLSQITMTDSYENYLYFTINALTGSKHHFARFLAFLETFDVIPIPF